MSFPPTTRKDHQRFCEVEGWTARRSARGKTGDHYRYELTLPDGDVLWTRISHPPNRTEYGSGMWSAILHDQLQVTEQEFWDCVKEKRIPKRAPDPPARESIPIGVVVALMGLGVLEADIHGMTKAEAIKRLNDFYSGEGQP